MIIHIRYSFDQIKRWAISQNRAEEGQAVVSGVIFTQFERGRGRLPVTGGLEFPSFEIFCIGTSLTWLSVLLFNNNCSCSCESSLLAPLHDFWPLNACRPDAYILSQAGRQSEFVDRLSVVSSEL